MLSQTRIRVPERQLMIPSLLLHLRMCSPAMRCRRPSETFPHPSRRLCYRLRMHLRWIGRGMMVRCATAAATASRLPLPQKKKETATASSNVHARLWDAHIFLRILGRANGPENPVGSSYRSSKDIRSNLNHSAVSVDSVGLVCALACAIQTTRLPLRAGFCVRSLGRGPFEGFSRLGRRLSS